MGGRGAIIADLQSGSHTVHEGLFEHYQKNLQKGVNMILNSEKAGDKYFDLQQRFNLNTSQFAAAKAFQITQMIERQRANNDGTARTKEEYEKQAKAILNQAAIWQKTEYNTVLARARSAEQWRRFDEPTRRRLYPNIKWLPSRSANPRDEHIKFYNRVWAKDDPFWNQNQPGTLWNCKCDWTDTDAPPDGTDEPSVSKKGLSGNPAKTGELFSKDASYFTPASCKAIENVQYKDTLSDMKINVNADAQEIADNVRTGRILLKNNNEMNLEIRQHSSEKDVKNPEYNINGQKADAKRLESWNVADGFNGAIKQGCKTVVLDLFKMQQHRLNTKELAKNIVRRYNDFMSGKVEDCYIVWGEKSMRIGKDFFDKFEYSNRYSYTINMIEKIEKALK